MDARTKWTPKATILFVFFLAMLTVLTFLKSMTPAAPVAPTQAQPLAESQNVYEKIAPATVEVLVDNRLAGSGWIVDPSGLVMTAEHVLSHPGRNVQIVTNSREHIKASVVAIDCAHDLALLQLKSDKKDFPAFNLASKTPPASAPAYVYGAPVFRHNIMLAGRVARNDTSFEWYGTEREYIEIVHYSAIAPQGMSGGVWIDQNGDAIGLQSGGMVLDGGHVGVSFVAPVEAIRNLLKTRKTAHTATLAIACEELWEQGSVPTGSNGPVTGLVVRVVIDSGPAAAAGIAPNDIITAVDGKSVQYRDDLIRAIRSHEPDERITLSIIKSGQSETEPLEVTLGCLEQDWLDSAAE